MVGRRQLAGGGGLEMPRPRPDHRPCIQAKDALDHSFKLLGDAKIADPAAVLMVVVLDPEKMGIEDRLHPFDWAGQFD